MHLGFLTLMEDAPWGGSEHLWAATAEAALTAGHRVSVSVPAWKEVPPPLARLADLGAEVQPRGPALAAEQVRHGADVGPGLRRAGARQATALRRRLRRGHHVRTFLARGDLDVVCVSQGAIPVVGQVQVHQALLALDRPFLLLTNGADDRHDLGDPVRGRLREVYTAAAATGFPATATQRCAERQLALTLPRTWRFAYPNRLAGRGPLPWPGPPETARLAYVGRVSVAKGVDVLLQALAACWADRPFHLDLYGDLHGGQYFPDLVAAQGLGDRVRFRGYVDDVAAIWADHHLLAFASRMEGAPIAVAEAMLAGRPVLATAVGAVPEWIDDGVSGFLAGSPELDDVGAALERAWIARDRWCTLGVAAHRAVSGWGFDRAAADLLARLEAAAGPSR